jgi:hypothetical protein
MLTGLNVPTYYGQKESLMLSTYPVYTEVTEVIDKAISQKVRLIGCVCNTL